MLRIFAMISAVISILLLLKWNSLAIRFIRCLFVSIGVFILYSCALLLMDPVQFLIIFLPIISSYIFAALIKGQDLIDRVNAAFLILSCQIIFIAQSLSLFNGLNKSNFLVAAIFFFLASLLFISKAKDAARLDRLRFGVYKDRLYGYLRENKLAAVFFLFILISFLWRMFLIVYVPPNNYDGMIYHLSRVAYWIQNQSLLHHHAQFYAQTAFPHNAEILILWTMVASKLDCFSGFIQFACYLLSGTLIYKCVRQYLEKSVMVSLTISFIWYCLPVIVFESTSVQNDLVVSYFVMFCLVYFLLALSKNKPYLFLSAAALALAAGVKLTSTFFAIPFTAVILFHVVKGALKIKQALIWGAMFIISFILFSSFNFVQNYAEFGNFFGPQYIIGINKNAAFFLSPQGFFSNFIKHLFGLVSNQSGMQFFSSTLADLYNRFAVKAGYAVFRLFHLPVNVPGTSLFDSVFYFDNFFSMSEDAAFFGAVGMIIFLLTIYTLVKGMLRLFVRKIKINFRYLLFSFLFMAYVAILTYFLKWSPYEGRYLITAVSAGIPVLAIIFDSKKALPKKLNAVIILYSIFLLIPATFVNACKPIAWLNKDKIALRCWCNQDLENIFRRFYSLVPAGSSVGIVLGADAWDYPLFGDGLKNTVVPLDIRSARRGKFDFIVTSENTLAGEKELSTFIIENYSEKSILGEGMHGKWVLYVPKHVL